MRRVWWWLRAGLGSFIGSPVIGILGSRFDNRKLLCIGFIGFGICALMFGTVNLDIGPLTLLLPITLTGFALSFVFVPLATMTTITISNQEMGNATGLFNMLRNIGGSVGISMATTEITRRAALHQSEIGAHLTPSSPIFQDAVRGMSPYMGQGPWACRGASGGDEHDLPDAGAPGGTAGVCGCLPLDGSAGVCLRGGGVAVRRAAGSLEGATGGDALRTSILACGGSRADRSIHLHSCTDSYLLLSSHACQPATYSRSRGCERLRGLILLPGAAASLQAQKAAKAPAKSTPAKIAPHLVVMSESVVLNQWTHTLKLVNAPRT